MWNFGIDHMKVHYWMTVCPLSSVLITKNWKRMWGFPVLGIWRCVVGELLHEVSKKCYGTLSWTSVGMLSYMRKAGIHKKRTAHLTVILELSRPDLYSNIQEEVRVKRELISGKLAAILPPSRTLYKTVCFNLYDNVNLSAVLYKREYWFLIVREKYCFRMIPRRLQRGICVSSLREVTKNSSKRWMEKPKTLIVCLSLKSFSYLHSVLSLHSINSVTENQSHILP